MKLQQNAIFYYTILINLLLILFLTSYAASSSTSNKCQGESGGLWGARGECNKFTKQCQPGKCIQGNCVSGKGKLIFPSGGSYSGNFLDQQFSGHGTLLFCKKTKYSGQFQNDQYHGFGIKYYANGKINYQGQWQLDKMNGKGKLFYKNGNPQYFGQFIKGKLYGYGTYFSPQGKKYYQGYWRNNTRHGSGKTFYASGQIRYKGVYQYDHFIKGTRFTRSGKKFHILNLEKSFYRSCNKEWAQKNYRGYKKDILVTAISLYNQNISMVENDTFDPKQFNKYSAPTIKIFQNICPITRKQFIGK